MRIPIVLIIALTYVGTVIGAGFASGQEVWQFFSRFGSQGIWGILLAAISFAVVGGLALNKGREGVDNFGKLLLHAYPRGTARVLEGMTAAFLVTSVIVCTSGGAGTLRGFGVPTWLGSLVTLALTLVIGYGGAEGLTKLNLIVVPYLTVITVITSLMVHPVPAQSIKEPHSWFWLLSAILYVSYNLFTAIMVLLGAGTWTRSRQEGWFAAIIGAVILAALLYAEHRVLNGLVSVTDLPMVNMALQVHSFLGKLYAVSLWLALWSTGVSIVFAFRQRYGKVMVPVLALTLLLPQWSFGTLVSRLYPVMGSLAVMLWLPLFVSIKGEKE